MRYNPPLIPLRGGEVVGVNFRKILKLLRTDFPLERGFKGCELSCYRLLYHFFLGRCGADDFGLVGV
jgi:hypothetical protein